MTIRKQLYFSMILVLLVSIVMGAVGQFSQAQIKASPRNTDISPATYQTWQTSTLEEGAAAVATFLSAEATSDPQRPFATNDVWTEGSLAALNQLHLAITSLSPDTSEVGKDLLREQLIQTVRGLELKPTGSFDGVQTSLNHYPDQNLLYQLESRVLSEPGQDTEKFDIIFLLDWSGSMDFATAGAPNGRLHAKNAIETMSKKLIEEAPGSRIKLMGMNATISNELSGNGLNAQRETPFFSVEDDYQTIINDAFSVAPNKTEDNMAYAVKYATEKMEAEMRSDATPVIIAMSDFQLNVTGYNRDARPYYVQFVKDYYNSRIIASRTSATPIYLSVTYENRNATSYPMIVETIDPYRNERWDNRIFRRTQSITAQGMSNEIADMINGFLISMKWTWNQSYSTDLTFKAGSFVGDAGVTSTSVSDNMAFTAEIAPAEARYSAVGSGSFSTYKKGEKIAAYKKSTLHYDSINAPSVSPIPELFAPITDAAVNLHVYKGKGAKSDPVNYALSKTVVSPNYQAYSGKDYLDKATQLASLKYGSSLTLAKAKNGLKKVLGADAYDKLNFDTGVANAASLKMQFDSSKNVFNLYAEGIDIPADLTVRFVNKSGANLPGYGPIILPSFVDEKVDLTEEEQIIERLAALHEAGYDIVTRPTNETVTVEDGGTVVSYVLEKATSSVLVEFTNTEGAPVRGNLELTGKEVGTSVDLTSDADVLAALASLSVEGYDLVTRPTEETITVKRTPETVRYVFTRRDAKLTIRFVDEDGNDLKHSAGITLDKKAGDRVNLTENQAVQDMITLIKADDYDLVSRPENEDKVLVQPGGTVVKYQFTGKLLFISAPKSIDFGSHQYSVSTTRVNNPEVDQDLIVRDTRSGNRNWQVTATLSTKMMSQDSSATLEDALRYVYNGNELILEDQAQSIMSYKTSDNAPFNISDTWSGTETGDGLKLEVPGGAVKQLGKYEGELLWQLAAVP